MWKNSLKNVESGNNKILYKTLLNFFLQQNGTYFLNKHCIFLFYFFDIFFLILKNVSLRNKLY